MPNITFTIQGTESTSVVNTIAIPQRAKLVQVGEDSPGREFIFPFGPQGITYNGDGLDYDETECPGTKPLLTATTKPLRELTVSAVIADRASSGKVSVEETLEKFKTMFREDFDCAFTYGVVTLPYRVRITETSISGALRDLDGNLIQAVIDFTLRERVQNNQSVVTLSAISYPPTPQPTQSGKSSKPAPVVDETVGGIYIPSDVNKKPWNIDQYGSFQI